jgi:hypothetical protein
VAPDEDKIYEIHTHLLYELKWMIFAAARIANGSPGDPYVALIDSATVHGRNLFEFAAVRDTNHFSLVALGGTPRKSKEWDRWANNRVTHMLWREHDRAPWPEGLDNSRSDRFMVMAGAVLDRLEEGGLTVSSGPVKAAYDAVVGAARVYWKNPTEETHQCMNALYDGSRDRRPY